MTSRERLLRSFGTLPSLSFVMLTGLLLILWIAGGASRADVGGQIVVRSFAWLSIVSALWLGHWKWSGRLPVVALFFIAILALTLLQLVPLPPAVWTALPGHAFLGDAAIIIGQPQPWRPIAIVPGAAWNAAASLVVPGAMLLLAMQVDEQERARLQAVLLILVVCSTIVGLLQFSGAGFNNPLINSTPGQVSGTFANRNHFALFIAMGCVLAPAWAFQGGRRPHWRGPVALGLVLLFTLSILASGSRAGMILGFIALGMGFLLTLRPLRRELRRYSRWVAPALLTAIIAVIVGFVLLSFSADRAESISRAIAIKGDEDMRTRGLPTVLAMLRSFFPVGSGFGGFDPLFRIQEPDNLLKLTYFNHAHDDFLEIVMDGGVLGAFLIAAALLWWGIASIRAWQMDGDGLETRLGSALLLLVFVASAFDYPARTPMMMAIITLGALWLDGGRKLSARLALPADSQPL
ncbi:O-antigen ligase family protein [Sphingomonas melonis]|uniref:O-antigen ligase family protein n=1 Tax=Sphingomonas melonis TaxID=152682 RepID=UPI0035C7D50A